MVRKIRVTPHAHSQVYRKRCCSARACAPCDCSLAGKSGIKEERRREKEENHALAHAVAQSECRSDHATDQMCGPHVPGKEVSLPSASEKSPARYRLSRSASAPLSGSVLRSPFASIRKG